MRIARGIYPWIILAMTLVGAVWLYTYRVAATVEYIDRYGNRFHPSEHVMVQPWWSVYATVALLIVGGSVLARLLPDRTSLVRRLTSRIVNPS